MKKNYSELLKDPRWQRKRLFILNRDEFRCRCCYSTDKTLHIHHLNYNSEFPWDTPDEYLVTLCNECHDVIGLIDKMLAKNNYGWERITSVCDLYRNIEKESIEKHYAHLESNGLMKEPNGKDFLNE